MRVLLTLGLAVAVAACADSTTGQRHGALGGAAIGSGLGAAIGRTATATGVGAVAGSAIGLAAGSLMDPPGDKERATALMQAAETGQVTRWQVGSMRSGVVTPGAQDGRCRALRHEASIDGQAVGRDMSACKDADGTWVIADHGGE